LNPRPFGIEPESTALDRSATSTLLNIGSPFYTSMNNIGSQIHTIVKIFKPINFLSEFIYLALDFL
jgi:hypothetical protein